MLLSPHLHVSRSVNYSPCMHKTELWIVLAYIIHFAIYRLSLADSNILILHYYYSSDICLLMWKLFLSALSFMLIFKCAGLHGSKCNCHNLALELCSSLLSQILSFWGRGRSHMGTLAFGHEVMSQRRMELVKWRAGALNLVSKARAWELL